MQGKKRVYILNALVSDEPTSKVFDYTHGCSIPSNGMNLIIFDLCNIVLLLIILDALFNLFWHYRFYGQRSDCIKTKLCKLIQRYEVLKIKIPYLCMYSTV